MQNGLSAKHEENMKTLNDGMKKIQTGKFTDSEFAEIKNVVNEMIVEQNQQLKNIKALIKKQKQMRDTLKNLISAKDNILIPDKL
ncbi:MAG: hypothetical protein WCG93_13965 [Paludibacter sp.]